MDFFFAKNDSVHGSMKGISFMHACATYAAGAEESVFGNLALVREAVQNNHGKEGGTPIRLIWAGA
jgi:hypothetical protein